MDLIAINFEDELFNNLCGGLSAWYRGLLLLKRP
jgi:hypothetical protein